MYRLNETVKPLFAEPMGPVLTGAEAVARVRGKFLVSVGDVVTDTFLKAGITPNVSIVDGMTRRERLEPATGGILDPARRLLHFPVENPPGVITEALWRAVISALATETPAVIVVDGEEDLAALPAVLLAPEGALVAYGQPPVTSLGTGKGGVVVVEVAPALRARIKLLLSKMEVV